MCNIGLCMHAYEKYSALIKFLNRLSYIQVRRSNVFHQGKRALSCEVSVQSVQSMGLKALTLPLISSYRAYFQHLEGESFDIHKLFSVLWDRTSSIEGVSIYLRRMFVLAQL